MAVAALCAAAVWTACGGEEERPRVRELPQPATGPYVSVAVDNHFHDIHPEDDVAIGADRALVFENQGRNLHNVTIPGTEVDEDLEVGERLRLEPVGEELDGPGTYQVLCRFHADEGMTGSFRVTGA